MHYTDLSSVRRWHFGTARQWLEIFQLNLLKYQYSTVWVCHSRVPISPVGIKFPLIGNHWIRLIIIRLCSIIQVRKVNIPIFVNYLNILLALSRLRDHPFATIIYSKIQPHINNATFRVAEVKLDREIWKHAINGDEKLKHTLSSGSEAMHRVWYLHYLHWIIERSSLYFWKAMTSAVCTGNRVPSAQECAIVPGSCNIHATIQNCIRNQQKSANPSDINTSMTTDKCQISVFYNNAHVN